MEQDAEGRLFGLINRGKRLLVYRHGHLDGVQGCVDEHAHLVALLFTFQDYAGRYGTAIRS